MRTHRFIGDFNLSQNEILIDGDMRHQLVSVLRAKAGDTLVLSDGTGNEAICEIIDAGEVRVRVIERRENAVESKAKISLYCSVLKRENFELVVQKATEVGVFEIIPIVTDRTIKQRVKFDRLKKIAREAAEQSGRGIVPVVQEIHSLKDAIERARDRDVQVVFDLGEQTSPLRKGGSIAKTLSLPEVDLPAGQAGLEGGTPTETSAEVGVGAIETTALFIGPEGGWTDRERSMMQDAGFETRSLGPRTLRAETAAIVASYLYCG